MPPFGTGAVPDRPDNRDYQWSEIGHGAMPFDWSVGFDIEARLNTRLPVKDQDGSGSCGGQAWSQLAGVLEALATNSLEERSARFIYSQTFQNPPGGGSAGRDNANIYVKQGAAREAIFTSYEHGNPPTEAFMERNSDITDSVRLDAKSDRSTSYANVVADVDVVAQAIRDTGGVILGICGSNNGTWLGDSPQPPRFESSSAIWRHWLYAGKAKTINGVKFIGVLNSWGTATGEQGWQWLSEEYFKTVIPSIINDGLGGRAVWQVWTHVYNSAPPPAFTHNFATDIEFGQSGAEVVALQTALQIQGFFPSSVPATGYYGDITRRAVLAFQIKYAVASMAELVALNGKRVGGKTRAKLNELFNK